MTATTQKCIVSAIPPGCKKRVTIGEFDTVESASQIKLGAKAIGYTSVSIGVTVFDDKGIEIDSYGIYDVVF